MSALNSKIPSGRIPLHALEAQDAASQAKLLRNTDVNTNIPQNLTDDYLTTYMTQLSVSENMLSSVDILKAEDIDCAMMLSELSPLSLNDNSSETALPSASVSPELSTLETSNNLLSQLLGVPSGNNIFSSPMPLNIFEMTPPLLQPSDIGVIEDVIDSLTDVISKYLPADNSAVPTPTPDNVVPVIDNPVVDNELLPTPADDIYQVIVNDGIADLMLNGKEITQNGIYAADTIEKKDDALIIHQEGYDIIFNTDDAVDSPDVIDMADPVDVADVIDMTDAINMADAINMVDAVNVADVIDGADAVNIADDNILINTMLAADSTAKILPMETVQDTGTLINLEGEVIKTEPYFINSVFA